MKKKLTILMDRLFSSVSLQRRRVITLFKRKQTDCSFATGGQAMLTKSERSCFSCPREKRERERGLLGWEKSQNQAKGIYGEDGMLVISRISQASSSRNTCNACGKFGKVVSDKERSETPSAGQKEYGIRVVR